MVRSVLTGRISAAAGALALADLLDLPAVLFAYEPFASRAWELRATVTAYDAWYVALAESLDASLATVDLRLARAAGPPRRFVTPSTWRRAAASMGERLPPVRNSLHPIGAHATLPPDSEVVSEARPRHAR